MDGDPNYEQLRRAPERQQPQEHPLSDAVREMQPQREGQEKVEAKREVRLEDLDPSQKAHIGRVVRELKASLSTIDDGLKAMERQRDQTPEYQRSSFDDWHESYCEKMLSDFQRSMEQLADRMPIKIALDIQGFGPPGKFRPETFKLTIPPSPQDVKIQGSHVMMKVHSDNPAREADLQTDGGEDKYVSPWEAVYWMMRRGGLTRQPGDSMTA